jgi:hypothetical protein
MKKLLYITLLALPLFGISQNDNSYKKIQIKGTVISGVNDKPLEDVSVVFNNISQGTITNENGQFKFNYEIRKNDSTLTIEFSALGYKKQEIITKLNELDTLDLEIILISSDNINRKKALEDIANGNLKIFISSGIAPIVYKRDKKFQKRYNVEFIEFGCQGIAQECLYEYNRTIFEYLDTKYGTSWREKIRKDIVGLQLVE